LPRRIHFRGEPLAVYELLGIEREIPPILHHDKSLRVNFDAVFKAFK
jgi:oleate hydratase